MYSPGMDLVKMGPGSKHFWWEKLDL